MHARTSWSNPRVLSTLLLIFLAGAASGALTMKLSARRTAVRTTPASLDKKVALERFKTELNLDQNQVEKVEIVLDDFMKYVQDLQNQMDETRRYGKEQIVKILNEEQRTKFETLLTEIQNTPLVR